MKKLSVLFLIFAVLLSNVMCAAVAYSYRDMLCGIAHCGYSAPARIAFLLSIPFAIAIAVCLVLSFVFWRKSKKR